ncbi:MAG: DNA-deoxyinosine glycosylase [Spirochaeta sp.]
MILQSFEPVYSQDIHVLILGSMPGERSLREQEYYAHPRNLFWPFMYTLFGIEPGAPYQQRLGQLTEHGIGLWDVLKNCIRSGSLDSNIQAGSEFPNDIPAIIAECTQLSAVCFNGRKAEQSFNRYVLNKLSAESIQRLTFLRLPSTSPANAGLTRESKLSEWSILKDYAG